LPAKTWSSERGCDYVAKTYPSGGTAGTVGLQGESGSVVSVNHPDWPRRQGKGNVGGPFLLTRRWAENSHPSFQTAAIGKNLVTGELVGASYDGALTLQGSAITWPTLSPLSDELLASYGNGAISRAMPTRPQANLVVTLAELLKDGIPRMLGLETFRSKGRPRGVANDYLNYQFGIAPLWRDLNAMCHSVVYADEIIRRYKSEGNKPLDRRLQLDNTTSSSMTTLGSIIPGAATNTRTWWSAPTAAPLTVLATSSRRTWFEGVFRYHVPMGDDFLSRSRRYAQQANHLLGIAPTPEVIWNLAPWTWLSDWFLDTGDVLSFASSAVVDGLVLERGYIMSHGRSTRLYTWNGGAVAAAATPHRGGAYAKEPAGSVTAVSTLRGVETKQRFPSRPFGFSSQPFTGFSPSQLAILTALGLSRT